MLERQTIDKAYCRLPAVGEEDFLKTISSYLESEYTANEEKILNCLWSCANDRNPSFGNGVAIYYTKTNIVTRSQAILTTITHPIDYRAYDDLKADVIAFVLCPEHEAHTLLRTVSRLSRNLRNQDLLTKIRDAQDAEAMKLIFENPNGWLVAAA